MTDLKQTVKEFLTILDSVEISDNDREFRPVYITSCRVLLSTKLGKILEDMRTLSEYNKNEISIYDVRPEITLRNL